MQFSSRKDFLFTSIMFAVCTLLIGITLKIYIESSHIIQMWPLLIILSVTVFLLWIFFYTSYELTPTVFKYRSGPIQGEIPIHSIREIVKNKTLWVGLKPATATKGLIIKYNKFDEIYISPNSNDSFINKILELNKDIIIR